MTSGIADGPVLDVRNLKMHYPITSGVFLQKNEGVVKAVDGISFTIGKGETLGLVGESGCGKTTTGRCVLMLQKPTSGSVYFQGQDLSGMSGSALRAIRRHMQIIFQDPYGSLNPRMTVGSTVEEPLIIHRLSSSKKERRERVSQLLDLVGLNPSMAGRFPHEFSGGQRQRIGIARALAVEPSFIVCDEPVSSLDVSIQAQVINLLKDLQEKLGLTYLFISHDLSIVRHICDRVLVMYLGRIMEVATRDELHSNPQHPYTKALLSAVPIPDPRIEAQRERIILSGEVPSSTQVPSGCVFRTRCPMAIDRCAVEVPEMRETSSGHQVACIRV